MYVGAKIRRAEEPSRPGFCRCMVGKRAVELCCWGRRRTATTSCRQGCESGGKSGGTRWWYQQSLPTWMAVPNKRLCSSKIWTNWYIIVCAEPFSFHSGQRRPFGIFEVVRVTSHHGHVSEMHGSGRWDRVRIYYKNFCDPIYHGIIKLEAACKVSVANLERRKVPG